MALKDWFGYPGMTEDKNMDEIVKLMHQHIDMVNKQNEAFASFTNAIDAVSKALLRLNERIERLEQMVDMHQANSHTNMVN